MDDLTIRASVLIASHRSQFLQRAIDSVMAQTLPREQLQLLVNYSLDPDLFLTNWNDLCSIAKGEYVCILGDDDTLEPEYLATCLTALDASGADIAYSDVLLCDVVGQPFGVFNPPAQLSLENMRRQNYIWQSAVVRRLTWERVGGYDMSIPYGHDYDFWVRCLQMGAKAEYVPEVGWHYYIHNENRVTMTTDHLASWMLFDKKHPGFRTPNSDSIAVVY